MSRRQFVVALVLAIVLGLAAGLALAKSDNYVGAPDRMGAAMIEDWSTSINLETRTVTLYGTVKNASDVTLENVLIGVSDEELIEVPCVPSTIEPGDRCRFTATMYTGTNLTVMAYVMADAVPARRYIPQVDR